MNYWLKIHKEVLEEERRETLVASQLTAPATEPHTPDLRRAIARREERAFWKRLRDH